MANIFSNFDRDATTTAMESPAMLGKKDSKSVNSIVHQCVKMKSVIMISTSYVDVHLAHQYYQSIN